MQEKQKSMSNVPNLRFPEFKEGKHFLYKKHFFKDIFLFSTGKNIKQNEASPEFETPCVRYGELYHMYNEVIDEVINKTNLDKSELLFSQGDEILLPSAGEDPLDIGSASALMIKNVAIGRTINILKPMMANVYSQIYVAYYINQKLRKKISTLAKGSSISNVYNSDLKTLETILPNLTEQKKIASFLSLIDSRIQTQNKIIGELKVLKSTISKKIFSQQLSFKDDNGLDFPDWKVKKLGDLVEFCKGSSLSKGDISPEGQIKCIHYGELFTVYKEVISSIISRTNKIGFYSKSGDILMPSSDVTPLGLATASTILENGVLLGGDINVLRPLGEINSVFLSYLLNYEKKKIIELVSGTTIKHLYSKDLKVINLSIPNSVDEQTKIASFLSSIDEKIKTDRKLLQQLENQKKYLLSNLFI